ncbi:hypothetical protein LPJ66_000125 [Kickxella alabastrina]|uniref:Uncharacterized protein n=1 Tax=Kickxella alabastrina TaxID=61397 RepID=A0ACC1IX38_9FUNG|nr:hypothetical protein LPJ66_000125 [Kickxella alabastrina]
MKIFGCIVGLALLSVQVSCLKSPPGAETLTACTNIAVRKEVRSLTSAEWSAYTEAAKAAYNDKWIDWFGYLHDRIAMPIHGNSMFLVYHRALTRDYEKILRGYNPSVSVPYWNSMVDYQKPDTSAVLSNTGVGGNGQGDGGCVNTGFASTWEYSYPSKHCLRRKYNNGTGISSWYSPEFVTHILQSSVKYSDICAGLENSVHGVVHLSLAGEMDTMYSPEDPAFWIHHANIDRLFSQWQAVNPDERTYLIDGVAPDGSVMTLNTPLVGGTSKPAYTVMRLGYGDMCYTYDTIEKATAGDDASLLKRDVQKCIPRPNPATEAIKQLPVHVLEKFYPSFANGTVNPLENEMTSLTPLHPIGYDGTFVPRSPNEELRGKMPVPAKLTAEWKNMQNACEEEVKELEDRACAMVEALNKANYLSPYLF